MQEPLSYRVPMPVREFLLTRGGDTFPVCPRCRVTMEWEYMNFCDRCGQALDWERYGEAEAVESLGGGIEPHRPQETVKGGLA